MIPVLQATVPTASLRHICAALEMSRSWYYACRHPTDGVPSDDAVIARIEQIILRFPGYGYRRVTETLHRDGLVINHKRVSRLMQEQALTVQVRRYLQTTHRAPGWTACPNLVADAVITGPNQVWVADLTWVRLRRETGFLACVLDVWSRRCVGWALGPQLTTELSLLALTRAIGNRAPTPGLIHHSDQGVQYLNHRYTTALAAIGACMSVSAPGRPTQNAFAESFIGTLKREEVHRNDYLNLADAEQQIGRFIDQLYNQERLHSSLGYRSPAEFESVTSNEAMIPSP
jgi:putative transposase